jgi:beta-RFAP synthase
MTPPVVIITAPSRLHFGMFSFGDPRRRQFGGVGAMIEQPGLQLRIARAEQLQTSGPLASRVERFARRWAEFRGVAAPPRRIEVLSAPPQHVGLGVGTQLALAVGAGLNASCGFGAMTPAELAACMGRGQRSAVGTYGFYHGGLIIEDGKWEQGELAPLRERIALPMEWRFVLLRPGACQGISGDEERHAFRELPAPAEAVTRRLWTLVERRVAPAARQADFAAFSAGLYEFGLEAGMCFAPWQGGPFASSQLAEWVEAIRAMGVTGVGQSSWGPTVFALLPDQSTAEAFLREFLDRHATVTIYSIITPPNNTGGKIELTDA